MSGYSTSKAYRNIVSIDTSLFFKNGGNFFTGDAYIGLKDNFDLNIIANDVVVGQISKEGNFGFGNDNPTARVEVTGFGDDETTNSLLVTNVNGDVGLLVRDDRTVQAAYDFIIGSGSNSRILLDNANFGKQLQIGASDAGFNTFTLVLGGAGSVSSLNTDAPAWTMNQALRFDGSGANFIYCNNGGSGLGFNGGSYFNPDLWISNGGKITIGGFTNPHASALLEMRSTSLGVLFPKMSTTDRDNITSPATGLWVFNTTTNKLNFYNGAAWEAVTSA